MVKKCRMQRYVWLPKHAIAALQHRSCFGELWLLWKALATSVANAEACSSTLWLLYQTQQPQQIVAVS
jgi:hypothetical protein